MTDEFRNQQDEAVLAYSIQAYGKERRLDDLKGLQPGQILARLEAGGHPVLDKNLASLRNDPAALAVAESVTMQILAKTDLEVLRNMAVSETRAEEKTRACDPQQHLHRFCQTNTQFTALNSTMESITADLWESYERQFLGLITRRQIEDKIPRELLDLGCLLCSEDKPHNCHRRLVAEYLKDQWGDVQIEHIT